MKKIILILSILSIVNYSIAQQAVTLDAKSISTPKYADLTTIEAAITSPQAGMMVYNIALNQHMYYNGSGWTTQSAASSLWQQNRETISFGVGTSVYSATPNAGIPDGGQVSDIINVSRTGTVAQASDVTVFFVLNHTYSGDVKVTLKSPNGTEIELFSYSFGLFNDFSNANTISFNSLAASTIPLSNPFPTGTYLPTGSGAGDLNTLTDLTINGDWTLIVTDVDPIADNGTFVSWGISFNDPSKVGIGTNMPVARLDVAGNIKITDGTQGTNKVLTSDANGLASWLAPANGQSNGTLAGQMQYWNGIAWVTISPGSTGQVLTYTVNGPEWTAAGPPVAEPTYTIGLSAEQGGYIFWVSPDDKHGLVTETQDQGGDNNTWYAAQDLVEDPINHSADGAKFIDWRLPTKYELKLMYSQKVAIGGFSNDFYWSSTEKDVLIAWATYLYSGFENRDQNKDRSGSFQASRIRVRAVRAF
jgi:subtilisin-like proprotein convertase family protein